MPNLNDNSVDLVVTSPPYPMIQMWDSIFGMLNPKLENALADGEGDTAFELMHQELDMVWAESFRVLKDGGFICINIGDATRTLKDRFQLYSNHSRIIKSCKNIGFDSLPVILWRKQTNAPNKFMGSGMLPAGAYVTLEHEYILVFRKGGKRIFTGPEDKLLRHKSSYFWEERNNWFSDVWLDLKGASQVLKKGGLRDRSAAFPFELAYRLINMYSVRSDIVFDPFLGTGTTAFAAMASCRNSIGFEMDGTFQDHILQTAINSVNEFNKRISKRFSDHLAFVNEYMEAKGPMKYLNKNYRFPVRTRQEVEIELPYITGISDIEDNQICITYSEETEIRDIDDYSFNGNNLRETAQGQLKNF